MPTKKARQTKGRISMLLAIVLGLATIVGGIAAALAFLPRVTVVPSDPVDALNPFSASFTITNTNFIPLQDVSICLGMGQIATFPAQIDPNLTPTFESRLMIPQWKNHDLRIDDNITITIVDLINVTSPANLNGADIAIIVSYKPWILPFRREKIFRFLARKQTNGLFYWYSHPLQSKYFDGRK